jgi:hypothetical protein
MVEGVHVISGRGLLRLTKESKGWRRWFQIFFKNRRSALRWEPKNGFLCNEGTTQQLVLYILQIPPLSCHGPRGQ